MSEHDVVLADALLQAGIGLTVFQVRVIDRLARDHAAGGRTEVDGRAIEALSAPSMERSYSRAMAHRRARRVWELGRADREINPSPNSLLGLLRAVIE